MAIPVLHLNFGRILVQIYRVVTFTSAEVTLPENELYSNYALAFSCDEDDATVRGARMREGGIPGIETWLRR